MRFVEYLEEQRLVLVFETLGDLGPDRFQPWEFSIESRRVVQPFLVVSVQHSHLALVR